MKKLLDVLGKVAVVAIFCLAIWLLYDKLRSYSLDEIRLALSQISAFNLCLSFGFMILNYLVLMGYDWLALTAIKKKLTLPRISLVSFVGSVISLNFGALLGGSTVRYRLYSAWGFSPLDIIRLVLMLAVTFWVGAMGLAGLLFIFVPLQLPPELSAGFSSVRPLGYILFAICVAYHVLCWKVDGKSIYIKGKEFALPPLKIAIVQTIVAGIDLIIAAACLYVLFPFSSELDFLSFVPNYLLAQVAVVLTHVPGGVGVLEVVIMNLTTDLPATSVFASILMFRVIYYIIPLLFASVMLGINEVILRKSEQSNDSSKTALNDWFLTIMKYVVFAIGVIFCLSSVVRLMPDSALRLNSLPDFVFYFSYLARSVLGVILIVFAYGLDRKQKVHWNIVVTSLCLGLICFALVNRGWFAFILILPVLFPLILAKKEFTREKMPTAAHYPLHWLITSVTVVLAVGLLTYLLGSMDQDTFFTWSDVLTSSISPEILSVMVQIGTGIAIIVVLLLANTWVKKRKK